VETASGPLRKTPLNAVHRELSAKMVAFGGWDMPVEYAGGLISEHMAVRQAAGLFDVSHMGEFEVKGPGALAFLQRVTSNDVAKLAVGQAQYSALPLPSGAPADDVILYRRGDAHYLMVVNASNVEKDLAWLSGQQPEGCELVDRSDAYALIALQGPRAQAILQTLTAIDLPAIRYYHFADGPVAGVPVTVARTGYTGEDGFEVFAPPQSADRVWLALLESGRQVDAIPCGLGARDTLRLEAAMRLHGNDIDQTTTPLEADLGWMVGWNKGDFLGGEVLRQQKSAGVSRKLVGFEMLERGIARQGHDAYVGDRAAGRVTSGTQTPFLKKAIGLAYLPVEHTAAGTEFDVDIRGRRTRAAVVPLPFYKRKK
jgi:aminomethyltransferase